MSINPVRVVYPSGDVDKIQYWGSLIFEEIFYCRVRAVDQLHPETIAIMGYPSVGEEQLDKQMREELIDCGLKINDMVEYFRAGVNVFLVYTSDAKAVFTIINEYISAWLNDIGSLNGRVPPMDDLALLNNFVKSTYGAAKKEISYRHDTALDDFYAKSDIFHSAKPHAERFAKVPERFQGYDKPLAEVMLRANKIGRF